MGSRNYPLLIANGRYLTEVGGHSVGLGEQHVGIHKDALQRNTNLSGGEKVLIDPLGKKHRTTSNIPKPLYTRNTYSVKPIEDFMNENLVAMSYEGKLVLPEKFEKDLDVGEQVVLNSAVEMIPEGWVTEYIKRNLKDNLS